MKIQNALRAVASAVAAASLALVLAPGAALATEYEAVTVEVTGHVDVTLTGDESVEAPEEEFTIVLEDDSGEVVATTTCAGGDSFVLSVEVDDQVGEYKYTLYQLAGATDGMTYDSQVYEVVVYLLWDEDADDLYGIVYVFNDEGYKCVDPGFENLYYVEPVEEEVEPEPEEDVEEEVEEPTEEVPQTGDSGSLWLGIGLAALGAAVVVAAWTLVRSNRLREDAAGAAGAGGSDGGPDGSPGPSDDE